MKRSIRLKEWGVNQFLVKVPGNDYSEIRDRCPIKDYIIKTNEQGFMLSGNDYDSDEASGAAIFLGDSFVESMFVDETSRFHSVLERKLWGTGRKISCYNAGYSGSTTLHLINVILNKVVPLRPKVVFYILPSNDAFALSVESGVWGKSKVASPFVPAETGFSSISYGIKDLRSMLKIVHEILSAFSIPIVFATFPHRVDYGRDRFLKDRYKERGRFLKIKGDRTDANQILRRYCQRRGVEFLDLESRMSPFEVYSQDDLHMDQTGSDFLAELLYAWCNSNEKHFI